MDITGLRADTPGCAERIHLNNAGASLMPRPVLDAVLSHLERESRIGGYEAADEAADAIEGAYGAVATLLSTAARNIAFTEHATAGFVQALSSIPFRSGDVILTTRNDYVSNQIQYLSLSERLGVKVLRAPDAPEGGVDLMAMEELIHRRRPRVVAMTHVPTSSGLVQDVAAVGRMCREQEVPYLVDACQSVGQMPVDPEAIGCHFLSGTARKFLRGPRGVGFMWACDDVLDAGFEPLFLDMRGADWIDDDLYQPVPDARRFETWEFAWSLVLGAGAAARYATAIGLEAIRDHVRPMSARLRDDLRKVPGIRVLDREADLAAIVSVAVRGWAPEELVGALRAMGINTSSQTRAYAVIDYDAKGVEGALRLSPHYFNTEDELAVVVGALEELARARPRRSYPRADP